MSRSLDAVVEALRIDQSTKVNKSIDADSRFVFDRQPITDLRNRHPFGHCDLRSAGNLHNQNYRLVFP
jgi:hypothetical protein